MCSAYFANGCQAPLVTFFFFCMSPQEAHQYLQKSFFEITRQEKDERKKKKKIIQMMHQKQSVKWSKKEEKKRENRGTVSTTQTTRT